MKRLQSLLSSATAITALPKSIEHLTDLVSLNLSESKNLVCLPHTIFNFKFIRFIILARCSKLDRLPENLGNAESLQRLDLRGTAIR